MAAGRPGEAGNLSKFHADCGLAKQKKRLRKPTLTAKLKGNLFSREHRADGKTPRRRFFKIGRVAATDKLLIADRLPRIGEDLYIRSVRRGEVRERLKRSASKVEALSGRERSGSPLPKS